MSPVVSRASAQVTLHTIMLGVSGVIYTPHTLEPLKELGLDTHAATKLALKLHAHSVQYAHNLPAPDALLRRLLSPLIAKIRQRLLLVTLLIPIDFFLVSLGEGYSRCLCILFPLIDARRVFTACVVFLFLWG
eukprot:1139107-Pelagomonas_calceolata.AAC.3